MNSGATAERVYDALKARILERGFAPGSRLDPVRLANVLLSSATPVRDALHRLEGERLVVTRPSDGFHMPAVDAPGLQDLYDWNRDVLILAMRAGRNDRPAPAPARSADAARRIAACFAAIAARSMNCEHADAIAGLNNRLHAARLAESDIFENLDAEAEAIERALTSDRPGDLRHLIVAYHRRRHRAAADIVRALYRPAPDIRATGSE